MNDAVKDILKSNMFTYNFWIPNRFSTFESCH